MTESSLVDLARSDNLEALEQAWQACLDNPADIAACQQTLRVLCERDMTSRALPMASAMVQALIDKERHAEAFGVGMTVVRLEAHSDSLIRQLVGLVEQQFAGESWFDLIRQLADLDGPTVNVKSLEAFEKIRRYTEGHVIYHRAGWGAGLVEKFLADSQELVIRFGNGRVQEIPLSTALDSMSPLDDDDLRSMLLTAKEELERLATESPSLLIRKAASIYRGKISSSEVKSLLSPDVVPTKKWATFWKKAKAAAAVDPYLQVEGSKTRPEFVLRKKPLSLAEEAQRTLRHCDDLGEEVAQIRGYLERNHEKDVQDTILVLAEERIEAAARTGAAKHEHILDGILLLEKHGRHPSTSAATELKAMLMGEGEEFHPENFSKLATQDARLHAVGLLPDALGEDWASRCTAKLLRLPASVVEPVVQLLTDRGHAPMLVSLWDQVAPYPQRHPILTYLLSRLYADGAFKDVEGSPDGVTVVRVLLHLARVLASQPRSEQWASRLMSRVNSLLTGRRGFLATVLADIEKDDLAAYLGISERGGPDFPPEIIAMIVRAVAAKYPELTAKPERPFWDEDSIFTTRAGLTSKREEYRRLVEELIPANSKAIGAAASLGDLSENSEWDAAMEEQRNLTGRASMMDEDLRKARILEEIAIPEGMVAPGTKVTFTAIDSGEEKTYTILGPWDTRDSDQIINYLAPIARPLLGKAPGDQVRLHSGKLARIDTVERVI